MTGQEEDAAGESSPADGEACFLQGAQLATQKRQAEAIPLLLRARDLGSTDPTLPVLLANCYAAVGRDEESIAEVSRAIESNKAAGRKPPADWYKFAIPRVRAAGDRAATASWLARFIQDFPTAQNWRWAIAVFRQTARAGANAKVEQIGVFRLLRATRALADRGDYADFAFTLQQAGLPWEAVSVLEEGRRAGKVPPGDSDAARTLVAAQAGVKSEGSLEALVGRAIGAKTGVQAAQTGDAFLASANHGRALDLYGLALEKGGVRVDEVNLHRGIALRALGRGQEARTAFEQLATGPYADLALLWQVSIDSPPLT